MFGVLCLQLLYINVPFPMAVYGHVGEQVGLKCSITTNIPMWTGPPHGGIINFADSSQISPFFAQRDRVSVGTDGQLIITDTKRYDSGNYACTYPGMGMETISLDIGGTCIKDVYHHSIYIDT